MMYRQGDVLIVKEDKLPSDLEEIKRDAGRVVLAYGEVTGHAHAIHSKKAILYNQKGANDNVYLKVLEPVNLSHEEHSTITIPAGNYKIVKQREYTPEEIRYVAD